MEKGNTPAVGFGFGHIIPREKLCCGWAVVAKTASVLFESNGDVLSTTLVVVATSAETTSLVQLFESNGDILPMTLVVVATSAETTSSVLFESNGDVLSTTLVVATARAPPRTRRVGCRGAGPDPVPVRVGCEEEPEREPDEPPEPSRRRDTAPVIRFTNDCNRSQPEESKPQAPPGLAPPSGFIPIAVVEIDNVMTMR